MSTATAVPAAYAGAVNDRPEPTATGSKAISSGDARTSDKDARTSDKDARTSDKPEPLDPPMVPLALAGLAVWAIVGLALLPLRSRLAADGHSSWLWTCLAGFLLGIPGLLVMARHDANRRRRRAAATGDVRGADGEQAGR